MILLILFLIILLLLVYLLFAPIYLEINSISGLFRLRFHKLASACLIMNENSLKVHMRIAAWRKQIDLLSAKKKKVRPASSKKDRYKVSRVKIKSLIRSFQIKKFHLTIDTGEMPVNAVLYPAFYFLGKYNNKSIEMNFMNQNDIVLEVKNNFARMIRAYYFS